MSHSWYTAIHFSYGTISRHLEGIRICFDAKSSLLAGAGVYGVAVYVMRRDNPRLRWAGVALMGITAMQWVEGALWLDGPTRDGFRNRLLTMGLIPVALLVQAWGPLLGSLFVLPVRRRRLQFFLLLLLGLSIVVSARVIHQPTYTQVTPQGHLNWWSPGNPPVFSPWAYGLWAFVIGAPFLLWWRPFWQSALIVSWGWGWATLSYLVTDSAASHWCFFVSFYAVFVLLYAMLVKDDPNPMRSQALNN